MALPPPRPAPPVPNDWWMPGRTVLVPLGGAGADRPWRFFVVTAPCVLAAVVLIALGRSRTMGSDALTVGGSICAVIAVISGFVGLAGISSVGSASRAARRVSGDLGATTFGSSDPEALRRQAALSAIAAQSPFDSARVVQRRWLRAFATLSSPHPALVAERFRASIRPPRPPIEGRVMEALSGGAPMAASLATALILSFFAMAFISAAGGARARQGWISDAFEYLWWFLIIAVIVTLVLALCSGTRPMRRLSAALGGWIDIDAAGVRDRRGRC